MTFEQVLISGQAGLMAARSTGILRVFRAGDDEGREIKAEELSRLLSGYSDLVDERNVEKQDAINLFALEMRRDQAMHAILAVLNASRNRDRAAREARMLELWLDFELQTYLEDTLYARPLPPDVDIDAVSSVGAVRPTGQLLAAADEPQIESQATEPVPPVQFFARSDPAGGADVRPISALAAERRGSAARARDRSLP